MGLEDASFSCTSGFVRSIEGIKKDESFLNGEGEDDDDRESPQCHHIESW